MGNSIPGMGTRISYMKKVEADAAAQAAEIERLRALLLSALPHVEVEGDDTLATIIHQELSQLRSREDGLALCGRAPRT